MKFVCPQPVSWAKVQSELTQAWEKSGRDGPPPPIPLILNGWIYSNDLEKARRWQETLTWARARDLERVVEVREQDGYYVEEFTTYEVGPFGGPMYLPWNFEAKPTPAAGSVQTAMTILLRDWPTIVGRVLGGMTEPLRVTGKKKRRLVVKADAEQAPPWGGWNHLGSGEERRTFTRLRSAINQAIAPLGVDHIDFEPSDDWSGSL
jgi:hypothetical protein